MTPRAVVTVSNLAFLALPSSRCQLFTAAAISAGLLRPHSSRKILSVSLFQVLIYILRVRPTASVSGSPKAEKQYSSAQKFWTTISYYAESAPRYVGRTACYRDCVFIIVLESYSRHLLLKEDSGYLQSIESERRRQGAQNHRAGRVHPPRRRASQSRTKSSKGVFP